MPDVPSADELAVLLHEELAVRLSGAYQLIAQIAMQVEGVTTRVEAALAENARLAARIESLERQVARGSGNSSKPPSPDSPYKRKPQDRSLRDKGRHSK